jgi:hypothetical protein
MGGPRATGDVPGAPARLRCGERGGRHRVEAILRVHGRPNRRARGALCGRRPGDGRLGSRIRRRTRPRLPDRSARVRELSTVSSSLAVRASRRASSAAASASTT